MRQLFGLSLLLLLVIACKNETKNDTEGTSNVEATTTNPEAVNYQSFGEEITDQDVVSDANLLAMYETMKPGDTSVVKFTATVNSVCQKKGCWMRLYLGEKETFVKFKDYGFFMPKDIAGQEVIVEGMAFVEETSIEDLKHFALDGGKSQEEIDAITEPEITYSFISNGVLLPESK